MISHPRTHKGAVLIAEDAAMTQKSLPNWLRTDLLIIVVGISMIGVVVWIAP